ncbi:MAG: hypothetical protein B6241_07730 [Spirochaetaceae bacterium 4572_59]|nr:MAG: hypothetical protein B6241_07730 [Spirochaetaceae bacterium 4572_59]
MAEDSYHIEINPQGNATISLLIYDSFPKGTKSIKVTYTAGYSQNTRYDRQLFEDCLYSSVPLSTTIRL